MHPPVRIVLAVALALPAAPLAGCSRREPSQDRWVTTENTNVAIDWDKVNEAYRLANGPQDLERRVNEIYPGNEVISIAVADTDARTQEVTGFFDRNASGAVDPGEKIFTIRRELTGEGNAQVQTVGHGAYGFYHSPIFTIASGMLLGSMLSRAFSPGYVPMYTRPYVTAAPRLSEIGRARWNYRASNRGTFGRAVQPGGYGRAAPPGGYGTARPRVSGSGRVYGGGRASMPRGGGRFGVRRGDRPAPVRLES